MTDVSEKRFSANRPTSQRRFAPNISPSPLKPNTIVYLEGEMFVAELVERQAQEWVAGIVPLNMARRLNAPMKFVPVTQLEWDEPEYEITGRGARC